MEDPPANSMKDASEAVEETKPQDLDKDKKYRMRKQQKIEGTESELKKIIAECVELEKHNAYLEGKQEELTNNVKKINESIWKLLLKVGGQAYMLNIVEEQLTGSIIEPPILRLDANVMDDTSIGHQNSDHIVQPSADEEKNKGREASLKSRKRKEVVLDTSIGDEERRKRKLESDKKSRDKKKLEIEDTQRELERMKARYVELDKQSSYFTGKLDQLQENLKQIEVIYLLLQQIVARQTIVTNELGQQLTWNSMEPPVPTHEEPVLCPNSRGTSPECDDLWMNNAVPEMPQ